MNINVDHDVDIALKLDTSPSLQIYKSQYLLLSIKIVVRVEYKVSQKLSSISLNPIEVYL